jgi:hypothetical protein
MDCAPQELATQSRYGLRLKKEATLGSKDFGVLGTFFHCIGGRAAEKCTHDIDSHFHATGGY